MDRPPSFQYYSALIFITQNLLFGSLVFIQNYYYNKAESGSVYKFEEFETHVPVPVIGKNSYLFWVPYNFYLSFSKQCFFIMPLCVFIMVCLVLGARHYSFSVDIWSVGCIFGELLGRRILFQVSLHLPAFIRRCWMTIRFWWDQHCICVVWHCSGSWGPIIRKFLIFFFSSSEFRSAFGEICNLFLKFDTSESGGPIIVRQFPMFFFLRLNSDPLLARSNFFVFIWIQICFFS